MVKKISVAILLTLLVLAFPVRLLDLSENAELALKIVKGLGFILLIFILMRRHGIFRRELLFKKMTTSTFIRLLPVIVLITSYLIYALVKQTNEVSLANTTIALALAACFVSAAGEEVVFRGYILNVLNKEHNSLLKNLIITSSIFALTHLINVFRYADIWSVLNQIIFALALGMLFGSIYALTKNLLTVSILHFFVNVPSALRSFSESNEIESGFISSSFQDNVISLIFMVVLMLPFLMLALHYIKIANKPDVMVDMSS